MGYPLTIYNFNAVSPGTYTEANFNALFPDVSFDNTGGDAFGVDEVTLLPDFSGNAAYNSPYSTPGNSTIATFSSPANYVSVTMGDYDADADSLYLYAYDAASNLVGSDLFANPASSYAGHTLSVSSALSNIAWVEFYGVGVNNNSVYWDNFSFEGASVIPAPSAILLGTIGTGCLGWLRRRRTL
jgi:hypothetical protein